VAGRTRVLRVVSLLGLAAAHVPAGGADAEVEVRPALLAAIPEWLVDGAVEVRATFASGHGGTTIMTDSGSGGGCLTGRLQPAVRLFERPRVGPGVEIEVAIEQARDVLEGLLAPKQLEPLA